MLNNPKAFSFRINILRLALKHVNVRKEGTVDFRYKSTRLQVYDDYGKGVNHTKRNHGKLENISPCNLRNRHGVVCASLFSPG